tara:strand:+ start:2960 stop:3301 length:342 start_codon:yes stop_codon:yes gene_type:complete
MPKDPKFPSYVTMGYTKIKLILVDPEICKDIGEQQGSYMGSPPYKIYLDRDIITNGGSDAANLVIHEILHHIYGVSECDDKTTEEILVNTLANGITELIYRSELKDWLRKQTL